MDRKYVAQNSVAVCERIDGGVGALRLEVYLQLCSVRVRSWCCHHTSSGREGRTEQGRGEELEEAPSPPRATRDRWMELGLMPEIQFKYLWPFLLLLYLIISPSFVTFLVTPCLLEVRDPEKSLLSSALGEISRALLSLRRSLDLVGRTELGNGPRERASLNVFRMSTRS